MWQVYARYSLTSLRMRLIMLLSNAGGPLILNAIPAQAPGTALCKTSTFVKHIFYRISSS